jgi:hypothetical protein
MPIYEATIIIREAEVTFRFPESDIESARVRVQEEVDNMIDQCVKVAVAKVGKP